MTACLTSEKKLGRLIRLSRQAANLSQRELAKQVFVTQNTVSRYERGETVPDALMLMAIAEVLGQELEYFRV